ncbi:hypothetical protein HPB50_025785 [Hyalomma asiaticum]|uniref:Uncharacterized protein n=1 Tax=Hyalomma asiaticum TaxID=266040 RepID=A0ACB7ST89_HYAAI|nr:hypothetical protein HPB50_025785 [Hyalomma asiaticum]
MIRGTTAAPVKCSDDKRIRPSDDYSFRSSPLAPEFGADRLRRLHAKKPRVSLLSPSESRAASGRRWCTVHVRRVLSTRDDGLIDSVHIAFFSVGCELGYRHLQESEACMKSTPPME